MCPILQSTTWEDQKSRREGADEGLQGRGVHWTMKHGPYAMLGFAPTLGLVSFVYFILFGLYVICLG